MNNRELRLLTGLKVEKREDGEDYIPMITGYAAVFDSETVIGGGEWGFREKIAKGAFSEAIKTSDVRALFNHEEDHVLGRLKAGTLRLMEDERGLKVEIDPPDTQDARDLIKKMQRGDIDQMSFAFTMEGGIQTWDETGKMPLRTIDKIGELWDVSVVTYPAYPDTEAAARSLAAVRKERQRQNFNNAAARLKRKAMQDHKFRSI
jgi:HK97 family phage prohead protease